MSFSKSNYKMKCLENKLTYLTLPLTKKTPKYKILKANFSHLLAIFKKGKDEINQRKKKQY